MIEDGLTENEAENKSKPDTNIPSEHYLVYGVYADTESHDTIC